MGYLQVNTGNYAQAHAIFDKLLKVGCRHGLRPTTRLAADPSLRREPGPPASSRALESSLLDMSLDRGGPAQRAGPGLGYTRGRQGWGSREGGLLLIKATFPSPLAEARRPGVTAV